LEREYKVLSFRVGEGAEIRTKVPIPDDVLAY
jgi:hypothetical protein